VQTKLSSFSIYFVQIKNNYYGEIMRPPSRKSLHLWRDQSGITTSVVQSTLTSQLSSDEIMIFC